MSELFREALRRYMAGDSEWDALLKRTRARDKSLGIEDEQDVERLSEEDWLENADGPRRSHTDILLDYDGTEVVNMPNLDWSKCAAVESIPGKVSGAWVFRGTRMPVRTVFENLEAGMSVDEITEVFDVTPEEVKAVLHFATESLAIV